MSKSIALLERVRGAEERVLAELRADQLQPDRQPFGEAAGNVQAGQAGHARRDRQDVVHVHRERVVGLRADRNATVGLVGETSTSNRSNSSSCSRLITVRTFCAVP